METCIRIRNLTKDYESAAGAVRAVDGIDLDVGPGEIVALLGPNGAGKTTTLDMILGFIEPTEGELTVFGRSHRHAVADGRVSAVLQTGGLLRDLTVAETVELVGSTYRSVNGTGSGSVGDILERSGLTRLADRPVMALSGGEQQRLRFGLALLADPDLLLLDEPTAGMDVAARQSFWATMAAEADRGRTIVFATHYLQEAEDFARRTVLLSGGRIVADGPTDQVRRRASAWTVRARIAPDRIEQAARSIGLLEASHRVTIDGQRLTVQTSDSDTVARQLLGDLAGYEIEISPASLEQAFVQLTRPADSAQPEPAATAPTIHA